MRTCGPCRLCCLLFPVPALDKPGDVWCRFACDSGCSIHDGGRPPVCGEYACYWLEHEEIDDELRPDRIGIVVTDDGRVVAGDEPLRVLRFNQSGPDACESEAARAWIDALAARGTVVLLISGPEMRIVYDRTRYFWIAPRDIEIALRYEQSQEAEELKRLGAVADDYRPMTRAEAQAGTPASPSPLPPGEGGRAAAG